MKRQLAIGMNGQSENQKRLSKNSDVFL